MAITLVQHVGALGGSTTTTVTVAPTGAGNCLIACMTCQIASGTAISGITLGGSADNWAAQATDQNTSVATCSIWADPNCAGGQTSIVVTIGAINNFVAIDIYEVSGLALTSPLDKTSQNSIAGTQSTQAWTSNATATTTVANEFWVGVMGGYNNAFVATTITGPTSPWNSETQITPGTGTFSLSGYQIVSSTGAATFSGTANTTGTNLFYIAVAATFKAAAVIPPPASSAPLDVPQMFLPPGARGPERFTPSMPWVNPFVPTTAVQVVAGTIRPGAQPGAAIPGAATPGTAIVTTGAAAVTVSAPAGTVQAVTGSRGRLIKNPTVPAGSSSTTALPSKGRASPASRGARATAVSGIPGTVTATAPAGSVQAVTGSPGRAIRPRIFVRGGKTRGVSAGTRGTAVTGVTATATATAPAGAIQAVTGSPGRVIRGGPLVHRGGTQGNPGSTSVTLVNVNGAACPVQAQAPAGTVQAFTGTPGRLIRPRVFVRRGVTRGASTGTLSQFISGAAGTVSVTAPAGAVYGYTGSPGRVIRPRVFVPRKGAARGFSAGTEAVTVTGAVSSAVVSAPAGTVQAFTGSPGKTIRPRVFVPRKGAFRASPGTLSQRYRRRNHGNPGGGTSRNHPGSHRLPRPGNPPPGFRAPQRCAQGCFRGDSRYVSTRGCQHGHGKR